MLTHEEETLLIQIAKDHPLAPNLSLFHLLCFDLHQSIDTFKEYVGKGDLKKFSGYN